MVFENASLVAGNIGARLGEAVGVAGTLLRQGDGLVIGGFDNLLQAAAAGVGPRSAASFAPGESLRLSGSLDSALQPHLDQELGLLQNNVQLRGTLAITDGVASLVDPTAASAIRPPRRPRGGRSDFGGAI